MAALDLNNLSIDRQTAVLLRDSLSPRIKSIRRQITPLSSFYTPKLSTLAYQATKPSPRWHPFLILAWKLATLVLPLLGWIAEQLLAVALIPLNFGVTLYNSSKQWTLSEDDKKFIEAGFLLYYDYLVAIIDSTSSQSCTLSPSLNASKSNETTIPTKSPLSTPLPASSNFKQPITQATEESKHQRQDSFVMISKKAAEELLSEAKTKSIEESHDNPLEKHFTNLITDIEKSIDHPDGPSPTCGTIQLIQNAIKDLSKKYRERYTPYHVTLAFLLFYARRAGKLDENSSLFPIWEHNYKAYFHCVQSIRDLLQNKKFGAIKPDLATYLQTNIPPSKNYPYQHALVPYGKKENKMTNAPVSLCAGIFIKNQGFVFIVDASINPNGTLQITDCQIPIEKNIEFIISGTHTKATPLEIFNFLQQPCK